MQKKTKKTPAIILKWEKLAKKFNAKKDPYETIKNLEKIISKSFEMDLLVNLKNAVKMHLDARIQIKKTVSAKRCTVKIISSTEDLKKEQRKPSVGRYLIQPPLVGAHARDFRIHAESKKTAVEVLCREPRTRSKKAPVVSIGKSSTVRTLTSEPKDTKKPSVKWFNEANLALENKFIEQLEDEGSLNKQLGLFITGLQVLPNSKEIHNLGIKIINKIITNEENDIIG